MSYKFNPFTGTLDDVGPNNGNGVPGGSNTQIQFNDSGSLGGDAGLVYDKTTDALTTGSLKFTSLGTAAVPAISVTGDPDTGIYSPGANQLAISTNGTGRLFVDNNGKISIESNSASASSALALTGTWITGQGTTNTKPHFLIEPAGTVSTNWITGGTGLGVNAPSGFTGNLLDLQVGGASRLTVNHRGIISTTAEGNFHHNIDSQNGVIVGSYAGQGVFLGSNCQIAWCITSAGSTRDLSLFRDAANTLAQRNGTNAQTYRVYNTYTSATNYELGKLEWSSNVFRIGTEKGSGGGSARAMTFDTDGTERLRITSDGKVGVGTTSPSEKVAVADGNIQIESTGTAGADLRLKFKPGFSGTYGTQYIAAINAELRIAASTTGGTNSVTTFYGYSGSEVARIDSSGRLLVGTSSARSNLFGTETATFQVEYNENSASGRGWASFVYNGSNTSGSNLILAKTRGTQVNSNTIVQSGDRLGVLSFQGTDGTKLVQGASIAAEVDGTPGTDDMPGRLVFSTTADGASSPTERMRLTSTGQLRLAGAGITFNGDTATANELDDYEEGTCFASTGNWSNTSETRYTKIGRYIFIAFRGSVTGSSQTLSLPFTSSYSDVLVGFSDIDGTATKLILSSATQITLAVGFHKGFLQYQTT